MIADDLAQQRCSKPRQALASLEHSGTCVTAIDYSNQLSSHHNFVRLSARAGLV